MTSAIIQELRDNVIILNRIIDNQGFTIKDAKHFLSRYINIERAMEDLESSRDKWKERCLKYKQKLKK